jgi:hypothetical protein
VSAMNAEDASDDLIDQSQALLARARETLDRAEILVSRALANRQRTLETLVDTQDKTVLMAPLLAMQEARTELVTAIQQTTQAMHYATRYVQAREKFIQARVEWSRKHGK